MALHVQAQAEQVWVARERGLAGVAVPDNLDEYVRSLMYEPDYRSYE